MINYLYASEEGTAQPSTAVQIHFLCHQIPEVTQFLTSLVAST